MITEMTTSSVLPTGGGKIKRSSFKSRCGAGPHVNRTGSFKGYQTIRVSVPSSMVAELASKFNAVVVDANQGDSMQDIMKKVNKTLAKGSSFRTKVTTVREKGVVVRATVEKFESTSQKKRCINQMVVVRTNSNQRTVTERPTIVERPTAIKQRTAVEQRKATDQLTAVKPTIDIEQPTIVEQQREDVDRLTGVEQQITMLHHLTSTAKQRNVINPPTSSSVVKKLLVQFENGKKPSKPSVLGPKPTAVTSCSIRRNERRPLLQKDTSSLVDRHLLNKDKRLSIARDPDAQLESVLNVMPPLKNLQQPMKREQSPPREDLKQQQLTETTSARSPPPLPLKPNCSFLHGWKRPTTLTTTTVTSTTPTQNTPTTNIFTTITPNATIPVTTTSTTTTLATTTPAYNKGQLNTVGEVQSTQLLSSPTGSVIASLAEATLTATGFTTDTADFAADNTTETCSHNYNYIVGDDSIYEELGYIRLTTTDSGTHTTEAMLPKVELESPYIVLESPYDHYSTIDGGEQNIYDVVSTATTAYEDTSYETVQPPLPPIPMPTVVPVAEVDTSPPQIPVDSDGDENGQHEKKEMFDHSVEIDNSIYGINPPSESTSSGNKNNNSSSYLQSFKKCNVTYLVRS